MTSRTVDKDTAAAPTERPLRELSTHRPYWVWTIIGQLVNAPILMSSIAFAGLTTVATGRAEDAGVMVASLVLADVVCSGLAGKLIDGTSGRLVPVLSALLTSLGLGAVAAGAALGAPLVALCVFCVVAGVGLAGLTGLTRSLLSSAVPVRLVERALAVNATVMELLVVGAPLLAGVAIYLIGWTGGVAVMAAGSVVLALLLAFAKGVVRPAKEPDAQGVDAGSASAPEERLWTLEFIAWMMVGVAFSHTLGAIETAALPLAETLEAGAFGGGTIIAILAGSSALSGLGYAALAARLPGSSALRAGVLVCVVAVAAVLIGQVGSWTAMTLVVALAGLCTAPLNAIRSYAVEKVIPKNRRSEGFGWLYSLGAAGFAASGIGLSVLPLWVALAAPAITCATAVVLLVLARRTTEPATAG
ncbi:MULTISPECIES: MFS transporter [Streptomyces]